MDSPKVGDGTRIDWNNVVGAHYGCFLSFFFVGTMVQHHVYFFKKIWMGLASHCLTFCVCVLKTASTSKHMFIKLYSSQFFWPVKLHKNMVPKKRVINMTQTHTLRSLVFFFLQYDKSGKGWYFYNFYPEQEQKGNFKSFFSMPMWPYKVVLFFI